MLSKFTCLMIKRLANVRNRTKDPAQAAVSNLIPSHGIAGLGQIRLSELTYDAAFYRQGKEDDKNPKHSTAPALHMTVIEAKWRRQSAISHFTTRELV